MTGHWWLMESRELVFCFPLLVLLCFMRLPLSSPFFHLIWSPAPSCWGGEWQRGLEGTWCPPEVNPPQLFTLQLFKPRNALEPTLTQPKTVKGKVNSVMSGQLWFVAPWHIFASSWADYKSSEDEPRMWLVLTSLTHTQLHRAPSLECTICTNSHSIQLL